MPVIALILGALLALALVGLARRHPPRGERRAYAVGLAVAALAYVAFAVIGVAGAGRLALETLGAFAYGAAAWAGLRGRTWLLALGWAAHVAWDVPLHLSGAGSGYTPRWYPWLCVSFDMVIAVAVLASGRRGAASLTRHSMTATAPTTNAEAVEFP